MFKAISARFFIAILLRDGNIGASNPPAGVQRVDIQIPR